MTADQVTVSGIEVRRFDYGVKIEEDDTTLVDVSSRLNKEVGIEAVADSISSITIRDSHIKNNSETGVIVRSDTVTIDNTDVLDNGESSSWDGGYGILLLEADTVTLSGVSASKNDNCGIEIEDGSMVTLDGVTVLQNGSDGISVETASVLSRTTTLSDVETRLNDGDGFVIETTPDPDSVTIENSVFGQNDDGGAVINSTNVDALESTFETNENSVGLLVEGAESVDLEAVDADGNDGANIEIDPRDVTDRTITLRNVSASNGGNDGLSIPHTTSNTDVVHISNSQFSGRVSKPSRVE